MPSAEGEVSMPPHFTFVLIFMMRFLDSVVVIG